ncbi:hypothetical protein PIB30_080711, partial [Stylosanthes scabra]|nr:hypothetical protein [Stylosanthes scabra]
GCEIRASRCYKGSAELTGGAKTFRDPVTPEHEPPSADFMDAEGGEDDDQDSEGGVDEAEYAPYRRATKPKEHPDDSTNTASKD